MAESIPREMVKKQKELNDLKWVELEKRGLTRPKDNAERMRRLKEAHDG